MPAGVPVAFTQKMLLAGAEAARQTKLLKEFASEQDILLLASRVYKAMEYAREDLVKKDILILGGK